jgi:hypothetical protein
MSEVQFEQGDWVQHLFSREKGIVQEVIKVGHDQVVLVQWVKRTQQNWVNADILIAIEPPTSDPNEGLD